ncbi:lysophospholipid acyltransferase family protein [bacterium]|nr:lysophospholipid acyltransferase family protein [bacterium]
MISFQQTDNRFRLEMQDESLFKQALYRSVQPALERALSLHRLSAIAEASEVLDDVDSAEDRILRVLDVACEAQQEQLDRIPAEGPLIVVANHPFGGIEGLMLASLLKQRRPDVRIMANFILGQIRQLRDLFILVDPFGKEESTRANLAAMKETLRWLDQGGVLGVFPAGTVSHMTLRNRRVTDPEWHKSIGQLAQRSGAAVLPVFFEGQNGPLFQALGLLHPMLRTARLPHEFVNKKGLRSRAHIGNVISPERLASFKNAKDATAYLRIRTELQNPGNPEVAQAAKTVNLRPIAPPVPTAAIVDEIHALPSEALLVSHGEYEVYVAGAPAIPSVMKEIGRLREITFRANHEGTGKALDLDDFDPHYLHLFLWDSSARRIAAAYRLGQQHILMQFLHKHNMDDRARLVQPRTPPAQVPMTIDPATMSTVVREMKDLSSLIADIEADQKDIPILLKQYLKLGGQLLGFNVDPDFSDVLDGLILVDLTRTDPRVLERYMGKEGTASFLAYHRKHSKPALF